MLASLPESDHDGLSTTTRVSSRCPGDPHGRLFAPRTCACGSLVLALDGSRAVVDVHDQQDHTGRTVDLIDDAVVAPTRCITTGELQLKLASDPPGIAREEPYLDFRGWLAHQTAQLSSRPVGIEQLELSPDPS
jgi:hypothetical protein